MAEQREIFAILLNGYLDGRGVPEQHIHAIVDDDLILVCPHFEVRFPATGAGLIKAKRAVDDLTQLPLHQAAEATWTTEGFQNAAGPLRPKTRAEVRRG